MNFLKLNETEHRFETVIPHGEWDELKVTVEQGPRDDEPKIELEVVMDPKNRTYVSITLSELAAVNRIVENWKVSTAILKGENHG